MTHWFLILWFSCGMLSASIVLKQYWKQVKEDGFYPTVGGFLFISCMGVLSLYFILNDLIKQSKKRKKK